MAVKSGPNPVSLVLGGVGVVLLALSVATALRHQDVLAGGLAVMGLGAVVLAALAPRMSGQVEVGPTGLKFTLEKIAETGRLAGYSESDILGAIEQQLAGPQAPPDKPRETLEPVPVLHGRTDLPDWTEPEEQVVADRANLAATLWRKYERTQEPGDLADAIEAVASALELTTANSPRRSYLLTSLGQFLQEQYARSGSREALDKSVSVLREALALTTPYSQDYQRALRAMGLTLQMRYQATGDLRDSDETVRVLEQLEESRRRRT